ncbi:MAG: hypothetical protein ACR2QT_04800 [Woeseiaceae bacterium]
MRALALIALLVSCLSNTCNAEDSGYWSIEIPAPELATNVVSDVDRQFLVKSVSFDWEAEDTADLREFYATYFDSIGWQDPLADYSGDSELRASGWSSYAMNFTEQNRPVAQYASMWKATSYPAIGVVTLRLDAFEDGRFKGSAVVQVAPEVDMEVMFRLSGLLGNDPRNLFKLHSAVNGNPFELHTIALPANYREESDPLLAEYYQIVDEISLEYRKWEREYILD